MKRLDDVREALQHSPEFRKLCLDMLIGLIRAESSAQSPESPPSLPEVDPATAGDDPVIAILCAAGRAMTLKDIVDAGHRQKIPLLRDDVGRVLGQYVRRGWAAQVGSTYRLVRMPDESERRGNISDRRDTEPSKRAPSGVATSLPLNRGGTQDLGLTILRLAGRPLTVAEITKTAHRDGHDVMSGSMRKAMERAAERGLVVRTGARFTTIAAPGQAPPAGSATLGPSPRTTSPSRKNKGHADA